MTSNGSVFDMTDDHYETLIPRFLKIPTKRTVVINNYLTSTTKRGLEVLT